MAVRLGRAAVHGSADSEWQHRFFIGRARRLVGVTKVNLPDHSAVDRRSVPQLCKAPLSGCTLPQPTSHPFERRKVERDVVGGAVGPPMDLTQNRKRLQAGVAGYSMSISSIVLLLDLTQNTHNQ